VSTEPHEKVNILLVDDQPAKLLSYEVMLSELNENLLKAASATEAFAHLLKTDVAVVLIDVCMPELDGFQLAQMIREHPRFQKTAIIFVSAVQLSDVDHMRGYEIGAVDYVSVPVVQEVLRAKVKVFIELHRKTRELERLNDELERRVVERTAELEAAAARLLESEERRSLALSAANMGSWDFDPISKKMTWDDGQHLICGVTPGKFEPTLDITMPILHPDDRANIFTNNWPPNVVTQHEFRVVRPSKEVRWCLGVFAPTLDPKGALIRLSGVTIDITERKQAEEKQALLAREVDHRAKNALSVVQSILRLTRAKTTEDFISIVEGRVRAFAATHKLLSATRWEGANLREIVEEEMAPYQDSDEQRVETSGPIVVLRPASAQSVALALHELATNAAKYGALSMRGGSLQLHWQLNADEVVIRWAESGGPATSTPRALGFGLRIVRSCIEEQANGTVVCDWRPEGLACTLTIPVSQVTGVVDEANAPEPELPTHANGHSYNGLAGKRILVVEDESLISMFMKDVICELGAGVIGPINTLDAGYDVAKSEAMDGAILDLNLGGTQTYPLAEILSSRGVPFVFLTGYDSESVDRRYSHIPVLQKPIEFDTLKHTLVSLTGA
jgi:two-component sensor histidine kinase/DNA-binding response OmpR family regulator